MAQTTEFSKTENEIRESLIFMHKNILTNISAERNNFTAL